MSILERLCPKCRRIFIDESRQGGLIGGSKKTTKKSAASRENGKLGGRPKKQRESCLAQSLV